MRPTAGMGIPPAVYRQPTELIITSFTQKRLMEKRSAKKDSYNCCVTNSVKLFNEPKLYSMKRSMSWSSLLLVIVFFSAKIAKAQMVGPNAYVDATNLELGIDGAGGFEGANTGTSPPFPTMNPRSANPLFGFVANPQLDGWATFDGDFFTPGTPENGWGIDITGGANASNNCTEI